ncbi:acyltransferase family protein [Pseudomonas sp. R-28-1W-6]|uniref:acyltransferase n=1 Tax=Pseudomonas sp. R-28-1W-6 TaxID=2650101 RepID=UPI0013664607|nr:acyltransferase [Pseudomonas sp. R-28-1W-6]MWV13754.1 acyltransferase family protein [Pseudomonas sp. R-28-1W-6]
MQDRIKELDLVRAVAIIAVVMIHVASFYPWFSKDFSWGGYYIYYQVTSFAVPTFILLSGLLLSMTGARRPFRYTEFLRARFLYIFLPYCAWSAAYFAYRWDTLSPQIAMIDFVTGRAFFHLYFVVIIIQLYLLFPLFRLAARRFEAHHLLVALIVQIVAIKSARFLAPELFAKLSTTLFVHWIFYFYVGCVIGTRYEAFKSLVEKYASAIIGVMAAISVYKIGDFYYMTQLAKKATFWGYAQVLTPENVPYTLSVVALCIFWGQRLQRQATLTTIKVVAINSFGVYLCHMFFLRWLKSSFEEYAVTSSNALILSVLIATLMVSIAVTTLVGRLPYGSLVVGKRG